MENIDPETEKHLKEQWATLAQPLKDVVLNNHYREITEQAVDGAGLDEEGVAAVSVEVLMVLLRLQTIDEFQETLKKHPALAVGQGERIAKEIDNKLFATLFSYLERSVKNTVVGTPILSCIKENEETDARYSKLPKSVQDTIVSQELATAFTKLIEKHALSDPHTRILCGGISQVAVGLKTSNDFKVALTRDTGLTPNKLEALFLDIEKNIFKPIRFSILQALETRKNTKSGGATDPYREKA